MAQPLLNAPRSWTRITLEPNARAGFVTRADSGGTPSTTTDEYWDGTIPWLTPKEITANVETVYVSRTERCITDEGMANSAAVMLPPGTVLLTKRAPVGAVAINAIPMTTNQGFLNFQCGSALRPLYLAYWFKVNTRYLQQIANGSTYLELYKSDLFELEMAVPPIHVQDAILSVISAIQYVALLGLPVEQSVVAAEDMLRVQEQNRRLVAIRDELIVHLLSGSLDAAAVVKEVAHAR